MITLLVKKSNINRSIKLRHFCSTSTVYQNANSNAWGIWTSLKNMFFPATLFLINSSMITDDDDDCYYYYFYYLYYNYNYNKFSNLIDKNYLSLISALIEQYNRKVHVITRALTRLFHLLLATKISEILVVWFLIKPNITTNLYSLVMTGHC